MKDTRVKIITKKIKNRALFDKNYDIGLEKKPRFNVKSKIVIRTHDRMQKHSKIWIEMIERLLKKNLRMVDSVGYFRHLKIVSLSNNSFVCMLEKVLLEMERLGKKAY